ncbi:hypothetical protein CDD81_1932 [Ophiocordyceps australis]|uniref:Poly [ADP-ribose] polymerase n=1 Tax=Ophiocordyceps australis TaxID=1399860 RepID=A0A2C5XZ38_9HYPO|nr:hypothetical protein CDD81_1932 [Ophiocordyceps australis]
MHALVTALGGQSAATVSAGVTHLVSTRIDFSNDVGAVKAARAQDTPIVKPDWVLECKRQGKRLPLDAFVLVLGARSKRRRLAGAQEENEDADRVKRVKRAVDGGIEAGGDDGDENGGVDAAAVDNAGQDAAAGQERKKAVPIKRGKLAPIVPIITGHISPDAIKANESKAQSPNNNSKPPTKSTNKDNPPKKPLEAKVDPRCPLSSWCVYIDHSANLVYAATLTMPPEPDTDSQHDSYHLIQLLHNHPLDEYRTWTRWGRKDDLDQTCILGDGTFDDAMQKFTQRFTQHTGLAWQDRNEACKPGKYTLANHSLANLIAVKQRDKSKQVRCSLSDPVKQAIALIFHRAHGVSINNSFSQYAPATSSIKGGKEGLDLLHSFDDLLCNPSLAKSHWNTTLVGAMKLLNASLFPTKPSTLNKTSPPVIANRIDLLTWFRVLGSDMRGNISHIPLSPHTVHPLDLDFQSLEMDEFLPLDHSSSEYQALHDLLANAKSPARTFTHELQNIFRIKRHGEAARFAQSKFSKLKVSRRCLLWHGSSYYNFARILRQGLRNPPRNIRLHGPLGRGIYLADISSKSIAFSAITPNSAKEFLLLLCEAELGDPIHDWHNFPDFIPDRLASNGMISSVAKGMYQPAKWIDAAKIHPSLRGTDVSHDFVSAGTSKTGLNHNEYICYDDAQVQLRYLFHLRGS